MRLGAPRRRELPSAIPFPETEAHVASSVVLSDRGGDFSLHQRDFHLGVLFTQQGAEAYPQGV